MDWSWTVGKVARAGYSVQVADTEGNIFVLWQNDPAAR